MRSTSTEWLWSWPFVLIRYGSDTPDLAGDFCNAPELQFYDDPLGATAYPWLRLGSLGGVHSRGFTFGLPVAAGGFEQRYAGAELAAEELHGGALGVELVGQGGDHI